MLRNHFAKTAKDMILKNGVGELSVRKIADEAGYSLGTIYNHYQNLDELLWVTRNLLIEDICEYLGRFNPDTVDDVSDVVRIFKTYMDYYNENPTAYAFLYFHKLSKCERKQASPVESPEFAKRFEPLIAYLINKKGQSTQQVMLLVKTMIYMVHGILTLYISSNDEITVAMAYEDLERSILAMLER